MFAWLKAISLSVVAIFSPIYPLMLAVGFLILADLFMGILAAKKRGEKITSAAMRRTVSKMLVYQLVLMSGFLCETYLTGDLLPLVKLAGVAIGFVEFKSLLENANDVLGVNLFKTIIKKLGSDNDDK